MNRRNFDSFTNISFDYIHNKARVDSCESKKYLFLGLYLSGCECMMENIDIVKEIQLI